MLPPVEPFVQVDALDAQAERAKDRDRKVRLASLSAVIARVVAIAVGLVSVRLTLGYLGLERYGLWMTINSASLLLTFADFGMGNGLLTAISHANGRNDREEARRSVASVFYLLAGMALVVIGTSALAYPFVPWSRIFNVHSPLAATEAGPASIAFVVCTALCMPLGIVQRIQLGYQEGFQANLWQALASLIALGGLILMTACKANLVYLVIAVSGAPVLGGLLNSIHEFSRSRPWLLPTPSCFSFRTCRTLGQTGIQFVLLQLATLLALNSDFFVLAHYLGPDDVAQYSTAQRMFTLILVSQAILLGPLWPAYGEAFARKDHQWIRKTLVRSVTRGVTLAAALSMPLILFAGPILRIWTKQAIEVPIMTLCGFAAWTVLSGYGSALAMLMNGANQLKVQVVCAVLFGVCAFCAKILSVERWGNAGVVWATVLAYSICVVVPVGIYVRRLLLASENTQLN